MVVDLFIYFTGLTVTQNCWTDLHAGILLQNYPHFAKKVYSF